MSDSLIIAAPGLGPFELIDQAVGTPYEATGDRDGEDIGAPVPDTATVAGVLLDGDRVTGERSGNRTCLIPVRVTADSRLALSQKIDALIRIVNQRSFSVTWTPEGCPALTLDCFRGSYARSRQVGVDAQWLGYVVLTFPALPFGRSADMQTITVPASGGTPQLQVDGMNSGSFISATRDTSVKYEGASSARVTLTKSSYTLAGTTYFRYDTPATAPGRGITSTDLSPFGAMSVRFRWPAPTGFNGILSNVVVTLLLTSPGGRSSYVSTPLSVGKGSKGQHLVRFDLEDLTALSGGGVNLALVDGWFIGAAANATTETGLPSTSSCWFDDLRAYPAGSVDNSTAEGAVLTVPAVKGSARAPVSVVMARHGSAFADALLHRPPATQDPDLPILLGLSSGTVDVAGGAYDGTYSLIAVLTTAASSSRTITVECEQKIGGVTVGTLTATVTTADQVGLIHCGLMTLPPKRVPAENTDVTYTFTVTSSSGTDLIADLALCDVRGQTVLVPVLGASTVALYLDEPDPTAGIGALYASGTDRTDAFSVLGLSRTSGGPMLLEPGDNRFLVASSSGALDLTVTAYPRWLDEVAS